MKATNRLYTVTETNALIEQKKILILAGEETLLKQLKKGSWIGGTIPYFMADDGGCFSKDKIFVNDITEYVDASLIKSYDEMQLKNFIPDRFDDGFSYILIPGMSDIHAYYAMVAEDLEGIYNIPTLGWITGIDLEELGKSKPKTFDGTTGEIFENKLVAIHAKVKKQLLPRLEIINIFEQGDGDTLTFEQDGFSQSECIVNGETKNFVEYINNKNIDTRLPLVASYSGANINVSFQAVDKENSKVDFYAPLKKGVEYRFAKPVTNYISDFEKSIPKENTDIVSSCNCILNYLYSELDGKMTSDIKGPFTFGEIAYVLVNQTMVYLSLE